MIAVIKHEAGSERAAPRLLSGVMTTVNATEVGDALARLCREPDQVSGVLADLSVGLIDADTDLALSASRLFSLTRRVGLSLGDRYCLALGLRLNLPVLTGDRRWSQVADDIGVKVELFR